MQFLPRFHRLFLCLLVLMLFAVSSRPVSAIVNPLSVANNRVGIHIIDDHDVDDAAKLVNSNSGDWGYVTLVMRQDDRNHDKWQAIFDNLRRRHLIPIIRLATQPYQDVWVKPLPESAALWGDFLNSLNWVVKNRYVILFNEPNHAKEWGGEVKPNEYVDVVNAFTTALKVRSTDFFVLPAGFDLAAQETKNTMDATHYWQLMYAFDHDIFTRFDGWTSHSYPNPDFAASPDKIGRLSLVGYRWEMQTLAKYNLNPNLPVFITETGWDQDSLQASKSHSTDEILDSYWLAAYTHAWSDSHIVAITPFLLRYLDAPFQGFSWLNPDSSPKSFYQAVQNLPKTAGAPVQENAQKLDRQNIPQELITDSTYSFRLDYVNLGQMIWNGSRDSLQLISDPPLASISASLVPETEPNRVASINLNLTTALKPGTYTFTINLLHDGNPVGDPFIKEVRVIPPPSLLVKLELWYKRVSSGNDFSLLIYQNGVFIQKLPNLSVENGVAQIPAVKSLIPHQQYRFVIVKPYYLPRQTFAILSSGQTTITFKRLLPIDFDGNGAFNFKDILTAIIHPLRTIHLLSLW